MRRGFGQDIELGGDGTAEFASAGDSAAGRDHHRAGMSVEKMLDLGKRQSGLRNVVQPELQKGVIANQGLGLLDQFGGVWSGDRDAHPRHAQRQQAGRVTVGSRNHLEVIGSDDRFGANLTGAEFQMQQGFDKLRRKTYFPNPPNTLVTLTPSYPLVTFQLKPSFRGISLEKGRLVCLFSEVT